MTVTDFTAAKRRAIEAAVDRDQSWGDSAYSGEGLPFVAFTDAEWAVIAAAVRTDPDAAVRENLERAGRRRTYSRHIIGDPSDAVYAARAARRHRANSGR